MGITTYGNLNRVVKILLEIRNLLTEIRDMMKARIDSESNGVVR